MDKANFPEDVLARAEQVRLAIFDVDGVLTDGSLTFTDDGRELKTFHVQDGLGIKMLQAADVTVAVITSRSSPLVTHRMNSLGVDHVYQGRQDKVATFEELVHALNIQPDHCAYVGDDWLDLKVMSLVGLSVAVANARPEVVARADWTTRNPGGRGAVREVTDLILTAQSKLQQLLDHYLD